MAKRIGICGFGFLGQTVYERATAHDEMDVAFVHNRNPERLGDLPPDVILNDLANAADRDADLIVEAAHPDISRDYGASFLKTADYLPLSVTALADDELREALLAAGAASGHQLYLPVGALVGGDSLYVTRDKWRDVTITFKKNPGAIDSGDGGEKPKEPEVIFDGSARGIAAKFPRNVNTMVTCALLSIGLDKCRALLIADPSLDQGIAIVEAWGHDGSYLRTEKRQTMEGVSGVEMAETTWRSVLLALGLKEPLALV